MLLRTSSAPVAQSLFLHSPDVDVEAGIAKCSRSASSQEHSAKKISFGHGLQHLSSVSCHNCSSSNVSQKVPTVGRKMIRRAQSDGNLEGIASPDSSDIEEVYSSIMMMSKSLNDLQKAILEAEPSFSIYGNDDKYEEVADEELVDGKKGNETGLERTATIGECIDSQFCFGWNAMQIIKEDDNEEEEVEEGEDNEFKGLDVNSPCEPKKRHVDLGAPWTAEFLPSDCNGSIDDYYKKILREDPCNPLFLRNYGHYLETREDFKGSEDCYARASLAVPSDGEVLSKYANLLWEVNGDEARASDYFNQAANAAPEDSNVLAAYANFLWNTDEGDEEDENLVNSSNKAFGDRDRPSSPPLHLAWGLGINNPFVDTIGNKHNHSNLCSNDNDAIEDYYRRMIEENPYNSLFLGDYARFLHQTKGDLRGAEEYYSRAILEDPSDGQTLYLYADVLWQLYRDTERAASYYERAIQAAPNDSNVLAAYAKFLWDSEPDDDSIQLIPNLMPVSIARAAISNA